MNRLIIFDLDDTLIKFHRVWVPCPACDKQGCSACVDGLKEFHDVVQYDQVVPLPMRIPVVRALQSAGVCVGVATNQTDVAFGRITQDRVEAKVQRVQSFFGPLHWAIAYGHPEAGKPWSDPSLYLQRKPDPATLLSLIDEVKPDDAIFIGDSLKDKQAAARAKIPFLYADDFFTHRGYLSLLKMIRRQNHFFVIS